MLATGRRPAISSTPVEQLRAQIAVLGMRERSEISMSSRAALVIAMVVSPLLASAEPASHAAMRPLPVASARPAATGPVRHVDAARGDDAGDGSAKRPWKTLGAAVRHLAP